MAAPLALYLTRFSAPPTAVLEIEAAAELPKPVVTLTIEELEQRIEAARQGAVAQAAEHHAIEAAAAARSHAAAMDEALQAARRDWSTTEGLRLATLLETATADLRAQLSERIAAVLCPWLAEKARDRARQNLIEALDRLVADETRGSLRISGPEDLVLAIREARPNAAVDWQVIDPQGAAIDVKVVADATRLETKLAATLSDLVPEG